MRALLPLLLLTMTLAMSPLACTSTSTVEPVGSEIHDILLARHPEAIAKLELPESSRPADRPIPTDIPLGDGWTKAGTHGTLVEWSHRLPFQADFYQADSNRQPRGMEIRTSDGKALPFRKVGESREPDTWGYRGRKVFVRTATDAPPTGLTMRFPWATQLAKDRNLSSSKLGAKAFALRSEWVGRARRKGLFLPAPAEITYALKIEGTPRLKTTAYLLLPAVRDGGRSTGAHLVVRLTDSHGKTEDLGRFSVASGEAVDLDIDLSRWSGQDVSLTLATEPGATPDFDYVFLDEPALVHERETQRRVLLLFADTLRADHTSMYGHERDTTPRLNAWAKERGVVFEQARSSASWTLPSSRAAISGVEPERWKEGQHLGEMLGREGFVTVLISANIYLTDTFGFGSGWTEYRYAKGGDALAKRDLVTKILEQYEDRDLALVVQTMDPHFAYKERKPYRGLYEGEPPSSEFADILVEDEVRDAYLGTTDPAEREAILDYTKARYDQTIRVVDDGYADLVEAFGDQAVTVFFSDHGEEWFEHGRLAHGHFLYDSSVKVPLVISAPGIAPGRVAAPASLVDIVPTVLDLVDGETKHPLDGRSLAPLMRGEPVADFETRPTGFGWNLFGEVAWGAQLGTHKYIAQGTDELLFDLDTDPGETTNLADTTDLAPYRDAVAEVRQRRVVPVVRITAPGKDRFMDTPVTLEVTHPEGIAAGWSRWQHMRFGEVRPRVHDKQVLLRPPRRGTTPRELYILPEGEIDQTVVTRRHEGKTDETTLSTDTSPHLGDLPGGITIDAVWRPLPVEHADIEMNDALEDELRALGYME